MIIFMLLIGFLEPIILGFSAGLFLSFGFGTVFFALIQTSIEHNYWAGIKMAIGVVISDLILVAISLWGTNFLTNSESYKYYMSIFGGGFLIILGLVNITMKNAKITNKKNNYSQFFYAKGFILNLINPMNFFTWLVISASLKAKNYSINDEITFFTFAIIAIFLSESFTSFFSSKIGKRLKPNMIANYKKINGLIFVFIGSKLIYDQFS